MNLSLILASLALRDNEAQLRMFEGALTGISVTAPDGRFLYAAVALLTLPTLKGAERA